MRLLRLRLAMTGTSLVIARSPKATEAISGRGVGKRIRCFVVAQAVSAAVL